MCGGCINVEVVKWPLRWVFERRLARTAGQEKEAACADVQETNAGTFPRVSGRVPPCARLRVATLLLGNLYGLKSVPAAVLGKRPAARFGPHGPVRPHARRAVTVDCVFGLVLRFHQLQRRSGATTGKDVFSFGNSDKVILRPDFGRKKIKVGTGPGLPVPLYPGT